MQYLKTYVVPLLVVGIVVLFRWLMDPWLGNYMIFTFALGTILFAVWWGGYKPALLVLVVAYLTCDYLFAGTRYTVLAGDAASYFRVMSYTFLGLLIIFFGETMRNARFKEKQGREMFKVTLHSVREAVIAINLDGRITYLNHEAESLTGWSGNSAVDQPVESVMRLVNPDTLEAKRTIIKKVREYLADINSREMLLIDRLGHYRTVEVDAAPIMDGNKTSFGQVITFRDISHRLQTEENQARLAAIVNSSDDAIISKSIDGIITSWNRGAENLFGYMADEVIGRSIEIIIPLDRLDEEKVILTKLRNGESIDHFETVRVAKNGSKMDISLTISPIRNKDGRVVGASKIARDITERKEADRNKDEFLAVMAHELRNPLAPVRNSLEIMKLAAGSPHLLEQARDAMDRQVTHMERLVEDLMDISRISRNLLMLRKETVDLKTVIMHAIDTVRTLAEEHCHKLTYTLPDAPIRIDGDTVRLAQIFSNLLNNACKYTPQNGQISLVLERQGDEAVITIRDNGSGISPEKLPRVFELFYQQEKNTARLTQTGLGIGLSLVRQLTEMHGGNVQARSEGENQGSEFIVRLPLDVQSSEVPVDTAPCLETDAANDVKVLIVDDKKDNADSLSLLLGLQGYQTSLAYNGEEALEKAETFNPHVIFLDLGMPRMDGFETCRRLRQQAAGSRSLIIALTGWGQERDRRNTLESGFDGHLVKPVNLATLNQLLSSLQTRN